MFEDLPKPLPTQEGRRAGLQTAMRYKRSRRAGEVSSAA